MGKGWKYRKCLEQAIARWQVRVATGVFSIAIEFYDFVLRQWVVSCDRI